MTVDQGSRDRTGAEPGAVRKAVRGAAIGNTVE